MSAVDEYEIHKGEMTLREMRRADAAIAELEASLEHRCDDCLPKYGAYEERAEKAEAENTELRKQNEILSTARRLEEEAREQAEAALAMSREQTEYTNDAMMAMCKRADKAEDKLAERDRMLERIAGEHFPGLPAAQGAWLETYRVEVRARAEGEKA